MPERICVMENQESNHSLETGDVMRDIQNLEKVMRKVKDCLNNAGGDAIGA